VRNLYLRRPRRATAKRLDNVPATRPSAEPTVVIDPLEDRQLMAASIGPDGWTEITPSSDTRVVYVSASTGSDSNTGLTPQSPLKTIAKGKTLLRNERPDWLLLKRGDVFNERYGLLNLSGRSEQEPLVIGAYGDGERPVLNSRNDNAITTNIVAVNHVAIVGLSFNSNTNDPESPDYTGAPGPHGFYGVAPVSDLLIEDCVFAHYTTNLLFQNTQGPVSDVAVRRSVIVDANGSSGRPQGSYVNGVDGILFEENLFDHNGWVEEVSGRPATIFNHNLYMSARNTGVVLRGNVFANASSHGVQARAGGVIEDNLFLNNPIGLLVGNGSTFTAGGVVARVAGNLFLGGRDINGLPRGYGMEIGNTKPGAGSVIEDNIFAHDTEGNFAAMRLSHGSAPGNLSEAVGLNDLTIRQNIVYDWWYALDSDDDYVPGGAGFKSLNDLEVYDNDFQQMISPQIVKHDYALDDDAEVWDRNNYWDESPASTWFRIGADLVSFEQWQDALEGGADRTQRKYLDPNRTVETYSRSIGGEATAGAFLGEARLQSRNDWDPRFTARAVIDYVREGFQVDAEAPSAGLEAADVTAAGGTTHTFVVHYSDDTGIDPRTLDGADVRVTGPNGFDAPATLLGVDRAGTGARAAIYSFTAPGGRWDDGDTGLYTVSIQNNQVADTRGNFVRGGVVGQFWFRTDDAPPTATFSGSDVTVAGGSGYTFTVTYADEGSVDVDSLGSSDIRVTGPDGFEQLARLVSVDKDSDGSPRVATYSVTPPGGSWDEGDRGTYTVALRDGQVRDNDDNYAAGGDIGEFHVTVGALPPPSVQVAAFDISTGGGTGHKFKVYYRGRPAAVAAAVQQAWEVTGPGGFAKPATIDNVDIFANGVLRVVTYSVDAPDGEWDSTDNGIYSIRRFPDLRDLASVAEVADAAAALPVVDTFDVAVPAADLVAPTVVAASFSARYADVVTLRFSESVGRSLSLQDFDVSVIGSGGQSFEVSVMALVYDNQNDTAYLAFGGLPDGELGEGTHRLVVNATGITDAARNKLNGGKPFKFYFKKK